VFEKDLLIVDEFCCSVFTVEGELKLAAAFEHSSQGKVEHLMNMLCLVTRYCFLFS
jgi:hypothetical protein